MYRLFTGYINPGQVSKTMASLVGQRSSRNLASASPVYIEEMYESWLADPKSVHESWDQYFRSQEMEEFDGISQTGVREIDDHLSVQDIIRAYQMRGHLAAQLDPLNMNAAHINSRVVKGLPDKPEIVLRHYKLKDEDMFRNFRLPLEECQVALIVFSKNYATSRWCLNELVKIMECKDEYGQIVIPIFYDVDPSHVRYQRESFAKAFAKHESKYNDDVEGMQKVQEWKTALTDTANLKDCDTRDKIESECIWDLVDQISSKLCKTSLSYLQNIVGIDSHLKEVNSLLEMEINDVRIIGIWGMDGVGKTTIATTIFHTLSNQFKASCFLEDVKENAKKNPLHSLQNILLSKLLGKKDDYVNNRYDGKCTIPSRLGSMKVLIVLDNIDHIDHLEYSADDLCWFGNDSRVVVTTRNRDLIKKDDAIIYEVTPLPNLEATLLFNQHAFRKEDPDERFKKLSLEVVNHAKGLPLALKVWRSLVHKRGMDEWRRIVDKIKKNSSSEIVEKLKISFDGLEPEEQKIFLDGMFLPRIGKKGSNANP